MRLKRAVQIAVIFVSIALAVGSLSGCSVNSSPGSQPTILPLEAQHGIPPELLGNATILFFWEPWCMVCGPQLHELEQLYQQYRRHGLQVLSVVSSGSLQEIHSYLEKHRVTFPTLLDRHQRLIESFGIRARPSSVVLGRRGERRSIAEGGRAGVMEGPRPWRSAGYRRAFEALLRSDSPR